MRVLIMSDGLQGTLACVESLGRLGHSIVLVTAGAPSPIAYSSFVSKRVRPIGIDGTLPTQIADLMRMVFDEAIDVVIPIHDGDARLLAAARDRHPNIRAFVSSSLANVNIASDKIATMEIARELGILTPPSHVLDSAAGIPATIAEFGLPLVVKLPAATASKGTFIVQTRGEAKRLAANLPAGPILVQRYIAGAFFGVTGFADRGHLLEHFSFYVPPEVPFAGTPAYAFSTNRPEAAEMLATLVMRLDWTGGIDLDALRDAQGRLYLLEINPRFSGTLVFADKLGIDLPRYYPDHVVGADYPPPAARPRGEVLFVSVGEEAAAHTKNPELRKVGRLLKKTYRSVDSLYPDDAGLTAALAPAAQPLRRLG